MYRKIVRKNSEWPFQIFSDNFSLKDWYKFTMAKNSKFTETFLVQKDWKKFGMAKIRHSKFIQICNGK